jgi:hypothetical protein
MEEAEDSENYAQPNLHNKLCCLINLIIISPLMVTRLPIDKRSPKDFWDGQHKKLASEQITWVLTADELLRAFQLLAQQAEADVRQTRGNGCYVPRLSGVAMMLGALAIENLLKAIRLPQVIPLFNSRGAFVLDTHDLLKLAEDAGISLLQEERILLERLEQFLTWAGRYPIPLSCDAMRPRTLSNGGFAPRTIHSIPSDFAAISAFVEKLKARLPAISYAPSDAQ